MDVDKKELLAFQVKREVIVLFKSFLILLEDLQKEHEINFNKLKQILPKEYTSLISVGDYFGDDKFAHLRKRVLDMSNQQIKNILEKINQIDTL